MKKFFEFFELIFAKCYDILQRLTPCQELNDELAGQIQPGQKVLDAGCGTGNLTEKIGRVADVIAIDYCPSMVIQARKKLANKDITVFTADLTKQLPFFDGSFDVVVFSNVLYTLPNPWDTMQELWRVTKVGGKIIVSTPAYHAKIGPIISAHVTKKGYLSLLPFLAPILVVGLFNLMASRKSNYAYHFLSKKKVMSLLEQEPLVLKKHMPTKTGWRYGKENPTNTRVR